MNDFIIDFLLLAWYAWGDKVELRPIFYLSFYALTDNRILTISSPERLN